MNDNVAAEQVKAAIESEKKEDVAKKKPAKSFEEIEKRIEESKAIAERIEKANAYAAELLERQEALRGQDNLGGKSEAGIRAVEKTDEQRKKDEINEFLKSTGFKI